jgi:putative hydrolase of HD superfamily
MTKPTITRLLEFQQLLLAFSQIQRVIHRRQADQWVLENDTEHSYNLAMTAWYLAQWFPELDRDTLLRYALVHDVIEVHAGDTYVYGPEDQLASKEQRENEALQQLQQDWHDFPDMLKAIEGYERKADNESRFVYALDKIMPVMIIYLHDGYTWKKDSITVDMLYQAKQAKVSLSPEIQPYFEQLHQLLLTRPDVIKPK